MDLFLNTWLPYYYFFCYRIPFENARLHFSHEWKSIVDLKGEENPKKRRKSWKKKKIQKKGENPEKNRLKIWLGQCSKNVRLDDFCANYFRYLLLFEQNFKYHKLLLINWLLMHNQNSIAKHKHACKTALEHQISWKLYANYTITNIFNA